MAVTDDVRTAAKARKVRHPRTPDVLFPPRRVPSSMVYLGFELSLTILHAPPLPQASNAAADWAQKRKQALERATELRAQRKAAERASVQQVAKPVRGLESDPLPLPKQDASSDQTRWGGGNDASAAGFGEAARRQTGSEGRKRRQWGEPRPLNPLSSGANSSVPKKENRDPGAPPRGADAPSGRLMPWEREMLVKQAEEEATAKAGLPPTPSKEAIARVFGEIGEARDGDDPDVWGPPRPSPGRPSRASSVKRPASAAPRSATAPTRLAASVMRASGRRVDSHRDADDARDADRSSEQNANAPPEASSESPPARTKPSAKATALVVRDRAGEAATASARDAAKRKSVRPATARAGTTRRSPYASAAVPGFAAAYRKRTEAKGIKPASATAAQAAKAPTPAVREAVASAEAVITDALTPPGAERAVTPDGEPPAVDITSEQDSGEVADLLGAFAGGARASTRSERAAAADPAAAAGATASGGRSAQPPVELSEADPSPRAGPASGAPKAASKKPRLPAEMVQKIVTKAVEQRQTEKRGTPSSLSPKAASKASKPSTRRPPAAELPGSSVTHAPAATPIGFDEFLKLQQQEASSSPSKLRKSPQKPSTKFPFNTGDLMGDVDPAAAAAAARKVAAAKAPKRPTAAGAAPPEDVVVTKKAAGADGKKATRQMFDKRESRRMNAKPFAAAVQRWRNNRAAKFGTNAETTAAGHENGDASIADPLDRPESPPGGVKVYVRKRPLFAHEQERGEFDCVTVPECAVASGAAASSGRPSRTIVIHNCQMRPDLKRMFVKHSAFDVTRAFGERCGSAEVYETAAAPMVAGALAGRVGALFMYGQTGSGKTHTMEHLEKTAVEALFRGVPGSRPLEGAGRIRVAYFEIAGKKCTDLLSPVRNDIALKEVGGGAVGAHGAHGHSDPSAYHKLDVQLIGACEPTVCSVAELETIVAAGKARRATSATHCNASSSRSHAVLRLTCCLASGATGRLTLVDCAGSERKEDNVHHSAEQRKETAEINASLYALKECVRMRKMQHQRPEGGGHVHVPYRSSHLTRVLMECFVRPDAQLAVIGTVSPASMDTEHSVSTLKTVGLIGGREDGDGVVEEREDVPKNLKIGEDGAVTETVVERVVAPVRWSNAHIRAFMERPGNEKFAGRVTVPLSLVGRDIVRMSPLALQKICGGDKKLAEALHNRIRDEIQRCTSKTR